MYWVPLWPLDLSVVGKAIRYWLETRKTQVNTESICHCSTKVKLSVLRSSGSATLTVMFFFLFYFPGFPYPLNKRKLSIRLWNHAPIKCLDATRMNSLFFYIIFFNPISAIITVADALLYLFQYFLNINFKKLQSSTVQMFEYGLF